MTSRPHPEHAKYPYLLSGLTIYLNDYEDVSTFKKSLVEYFEFYNGRRIHEALGYRTPMAVYSGKAAA